MNKRKKDNLISHRTGLILSLFTLFESCRKSLRSPVFRAVQTDSNTRRQPPGLLEPKEVRSRPTGRPASGAFGSGLSLFFSIFLLWATFLLRDAGWKGCRSSAHHFCGFPHHRWPVPAWPLQLQIQLAVLSQVFTSATGKFK